MYTCDKHGTETERGSYCQACMDAFKGRRDAKTMTPEERAAEFEWWGEILTIPFSDLHQRITELVGRDVWTHELARPDLLIQEIRAQQPASMADVLDKIPADKRAVVVKAD